MAEVLLFHHVQGLTEGVVAFADELRRAGHTVHTPDLFDGRTFESIEAGHGLRRGGGLRGDGSNVASGPPRGCPPSWSTPASRSGWSRPRSSPRPGRARGARCCSTPACRLGVRRPLARRRARSRCTAWTRDPIFAGEGDLEAARAPRRAGLRRRAVPLPGRPALLRRQLAAVVRRERGGAADQAGAGLPRRALREPRRGAPGGSVARRPDVPLLAQRVDRRGRDDPFDAARQLRVPGYEGVCLQLRERNVLGVVGRGPSQLIRQVPGPTPEHGVAEEPDRHPPDAGEALAGDVGRDLAPLDGLVQRRQCLGAQERRCEELVLACDLDPRARKVEDGAGVDDEPVVDSAYRSEAGRPRSG